MLSVALIDFLPARRSAPISVIGLDVGTSGSRAVVVEADGSISASATAPHEPFASPGPAWAEQDPDDWWARSAGAARRRRSCPRERLVDRRGRPVGPDARRRAARRARRRAAAVDHLVRSAHQRRVPLARRARRPAPAARADAQPGADQLHADASLLWVRTHEPEIWARVRHVLLPKDYVRLRLSGVYATDVADASGTLMLDVARRRWSEEMLDAAGIRSDMLPDVFESPEVCARVSARRGGRHRPRRRHADCRRRRRSGRRRGRHGHHAPGRRQRDDRHVRRRLRGDRSAGARSRRAAFTRSVTRCPGRWHVMGVTQAAGLSLRWMRDQIGAAPGVRRRRRRYERLVGEASGPAGIRWRAVGAVPDGRADAALRSRRARGAGRAGRGAHARARRSARCWKASRSACAIRSASSTTCGVPVVSVRVGGGGARSAVWRQIQADTYGRAGRDGAGRGRRGLRRGASSPASAPASGARSTRRATPSCGPRAVRTRHTRRRRS